MNLANWLARIKSPRGDTAGMTHYSCELFMSVPLTTGTPEIVAVTVRLHNSNDYSESRPGKVATKPVACNTL